MSEFLDNELDGLSVDDFLNHTTRGGSSGGYLSGDWRTRGWIVFWFHLHHGFHAAWFHSFHKIIERVDKKTHSKVRTVVPVRWNCRDYDHSLGKNADRLLKKASYRDDEGKREHPPVMCPFCLMEDWLAHEVRAGRVGFTEPVFKFDPDANGDKEVVLHAGGIVGFFGDRASSKEKDELKAAKISQKDAWREKTVVKCNYLLTIVDDDAPGEGPQRFFAADDLGNKIKTVIKNKMGRMKRDTDKGNPLKHPYPVKVEYVESALPANKYSATDLENDALLPGATADDKKHYQEVLAAISGDKLDLTDDLKPGNCAELLSWFETYGVIDAPWRSFFSEAEKAGIMKAYDLKRKRNAMTDDENEDEEAPASSHKPIVESYRCDYCDGVMPKDENVVCGGCGAVYGEAMGGNPGQLIALQCLDCKETIALPKQGERVICGKCGSIHTFDMKVVSSPEGDYDKPTWVKVEPPKEEPKQPTRRTRRTKQEG